MLVVDLSQMKYRNHATFCLMVRSLHSDARVRRIMALFEEYSGPLGTITRPDRPFLHPHKNRKDENKQQNLQHV
jgi:hypothetical protein